MVLITGSLGKLGREVTKVFDTTLIPGHAKLDIADEKSVFTFIEKNKPDIIVHLAAATDVRRCEKEKEWAYNTNVVGTENLVNALCKFIPNAYFVYMSTPGVFYGDRGEYIETDIPNPANFYSLTKLLGEFVTKRSQNHLIVRANFVSRTPWPYERAFTDRFGTYLFSDDLAHALKDVIDQKLTGVVHIAGEEKLSMFDLARIVSPDVKPVTMANTNVPLARDLSLRSIRIKPYKLTRL